MSAIQQALMFLGNASAHFNLERRSKALSRLNPDLKSLVEYEEFLQMAPYLFGPGFKKKGQGEVRGGRVFAESALNSVFKAVFSRQTFIPGQKWERLSTPLPFLSEKRSAMDLLKSKATKTFRSEVPSKQHNVQEGLTCGVQEGQSISTVVDVLIKPHINPCFLSKKNLKSILPIIQISDWVTRDMYMPLKEVLANAPKAGRLAIAKRNWEKLQTLGCYRQYRDTV